jgi:hypothetical protein
MAAKAIVKGVVCGEFGKTITLTCKDEDGAVQDISAYTGTKTVVARSPSQKVVTATASFYGTGTDGKVTFSFASGDIDELGEWDGQLELLIGTTAKAKSYPFIIKVEGSLR